MHQNIYTCFLPNKYTATYFRIIERARSRQLEGYAEEHHVLPEALGGSSDLVKLTAREHFICHLLLLRMTAGEDKARMAFAAFMMGCSNDKQERYKVSGRVYELVKREFSKARGELNTKLWTDPEFRAKMLSKWTSERVEWYREMGRARLADPAVRAEYAARTDKLWADPEYREKVTNAIKDVKGTDEQRAKAKKNAEAMWASEAYRVKTSLAIKEGRKQAKLAGNFLSPKDAAELMHLRVRAVQLMVDSGELEATVTTGGHRKVSRSAVLRWLETSNSAK